MLIILLFLVLLALKLLAIAVVYQFGPIAALVIIASCIAIAYRIESTSVTRE